MKLLGRKLFYVAPPPVTHILVTSQFHKNPKICVGHFTSHDAALEALGSKKNPGKFQIDEVRYHDRSLWVESCKVGEEV